MFLLDVNVSIFDIHFLFSLLSTSLLSLPLLESTFSYPRRNRTLGPFILLEVVPTVCLMQMTYNAAFGAQMFYRASAAVTA
jgi:hypothetical protein